jgi:hypothetical protein
MLLGDLLKRLTKTASRKISKLVTRSQSGCEKNLLKYVLVS